MSFIFVVVVVIVVSTIANTDCHSLFLLLLFSFRIGRLVCKCNTHSVCIDNMQNEKIEKKKLKWNEPIVQLGIFFIFSFIWKSKIWIIFSFWSAFLFLTVWVCAVSLSYGSFHVPWCFFLWIEITKPKQKKKKQQKRWQKIEQRNLIFN